MGEIQAGQGEGYYEFPEESPEAKHVPDLELRRGFTTTTFDADLLKGGNKVVVKMLDTPNNNTCWAGFSLRVLDAQDNEVTLGQ